MPASAVESAASGSTTGGAPRSGSSGRGERWSDGRWATACPPATAGTEAASLARERHEALERALLTPNPCEASAERSARQELAELALDEAGEAAAVGAVGSLAQEGLQVLADDAMEDGALRGP